MANYDRQSLKQIQRRIYAMVNKRFSHLMRDDAWQNVKLLRDAISEMEDVDDVIMSAGQYYNYLSLSNNKAPYRDYETTVITPFGNLEGYIRCCAAGTIYDPFSAYDIVISLYPANKNESLAYRTSDKLDESLIRKIIEESVRDNIDKMKLFDVAIKEYGTTEDFREAGYILPDGDMLDFSEKANGGVPGRRTQDHRNIGIIFDEQYDSATRYMLEFINAGAIRFIPESSSLCFSKPLTDSQKMMLRKLVRIKNGEIIIDIIDENGYTQGYKEYEKWTPSDRIISEIDNHFNGFPLSDEDNEY